MKKQTTTKTYLKVRPAAAVTNKKVERILNVIPSSGVENDWTMETAMTVGVLAAPTIPASKDLREDWWKINDQGSTGSCVGWAAADSVVRYLLVKTGQLPKDDLLSARYVWMASKEIDQWATPPTTFLEAEGTSIKTALDLCRKYGLVRMDVLPFNNGRLFPGDAKAFYALAAQAKINSYFNLGINPMNWRAWLASKGPILIGLKVDQTWQDCNQMGGNMDVFMPNTIRGLHAAAIVGYTPDRFIIRNSWGATQFGDKGFAYASIAYAQAAFFEAYGVTL